MKSLFSGSAIAAAALLSALVLLAAKPSVAETAGSQSPQTIQGPSKTQAQDPVLTPSPGDSLDKVVPEMPGGKAVEPPKAVEIAASLPVSYVATAYSLRGRTASGKFVSQGIIAADPRFLPLGSRVHVQAGAWSGEYLVADTGSVLSHTAIVAREFALPAVVAAANATSSLVDGEEVTVDGTRGEVTRC